MKSLRFSPEVVTGIMVCFLFVGTVCAAAKQEISLEQCGGYEELRSRVMESLASKETSGKWPADMLTIDELMTRGSKDVRWVTLAAMFRRARDTDISVLNRQYIVEYLAKSLSDPAIVVKQAAMRWLLAFGTGDFNQEAKRIVLERFDKKKDKETILLAGIVDINYCATHARQFMDELDEYMNQPIEEAAIHWSGSQAWAATLVAARAGDSASIQRVLEAVESENAPNPRLTRLLRDLEFVAQPDMVNYIRQYLESEEVSPRELDLVSMPYAHLAANSLARMLEGFPMKDGEGFGPDTIKKCREWMASQKEWKFRSR